MKRTLLSTATALASALAWVAVPACGGDDTAVPLDDASADGTASQDGAGSGDAAPDGSTGGGDGGDAGSPTLTFSSHFAAAQGELPEGLTYRAGKAYVGFAPTGKIVSVELASGTVTPYASLPTNASNLTLGMVFDAAGNLYVGVGASAPAGAATAGVYKIPPGTDGGGAPVRLWAGPRFVFPNGLALDTAGTHLYVADSNDGAIYRFALTDPATTTAAPWKKDALLAGDLPDAGPGTCPRASAGFPLGANGIALDTTGAYVSNTDHGSLVKIAIDGTGDAGAPAVVVSDCAKLEGLDGIAIDPRDGTIVGAVNSANAIVRISGAAIAPIVSGTPLDSPASITAIPGQLRDELLLTNAAFASAQTDGGSPQPGLLVLIVP